MLGPARPLGPAKPDVEIDDDDDEPEEQGPALGPQRPQMGPQMGPEMGPQMGPQLGPGVPQEFGPQRPGPEASKTSFFRAALPVDIESTAVTHAVLDRNESLWTGRNRGTKGEEAGPANRPRSPGKGKAGVYNKNFVFGRRTQRR